MHQGVIPGSTSSAVRNRMSWFGSFLDLFEHNVNLDSQHGGEEDEEEDEGQGDAETIDVADANPCGKHVLNGPGLTTELSDQPTALGGDVG